MKKTKYFIRIFFLLVISFAILVGCQKSDDDSAIFYVNAGSTSSSPDGSSWENAFQSVQDAIDAASSAGGGEVWVAAGTCHGVHGLSAVRHQIGAVFEKIAMTVLKET